MPIRNIGVPTDVVSWQAVCEGCGLRYGVLITQRDDGVDDERPKYCAFCAHRVYAARVRIDAPAGRG